ISCWLSFARRLSSGGCHFSSRPGCSMPPGFGGFIGGFAVILFIAFAVSALYTVGLAYVALRVRDSRNDEPDPQLGMKTAFHLIHTTGILMILTGLTLSTTDLMEGTLSKKQKPAQPQIGAGGVVRPGPQKDDGFNAAQRTGVALDGVGAMFALVFWMF